MYYVCCVGGCSSVRHDVFLHRFPITSEKRLQRWLQCINSEELRRLSLEELKNYYVCHKHFEKRFITPKNRLAATAYPALFTLEEIATGIPAANLEDAENVVPDIYGEHNYSRKRHLDHSYSTLEGRPALRQLPHDVAAMPQEQEPMPSTSTAVFNETGASMHHTQDPIPSTSAGTTHKSGRLKCGRNRLVQKLSSLSPECKTIYKEYCKARKQLSFSKRAKKALKFKHGKTFEKLTYGLNPYAKQIIQMQINMACRKQKGRRFSTEEKLISLSIMKQSPKAYRFLQKIFILPSKTTLNKFVAKLDIEVGINPQIFSAMKQEIATWDEKKLFCTIIFDEMSLTPTLTYDKRKDKINGFVDLTERSSEFTDHALVFLLRGSVYKWQQPIAFYFCAGATSGAQLKNILKEVVTAVSEVGLKPLALVCDQGSAFQSAVNSLKLETRREQIIAGSNLDDVVSINGTTLRIIFDPSHLIKGLRNNFLTKNVSLNGKIATWQDIVDVYQTDCTHAEARLLHKLNDEHVLPEKIKKMKVKNCVRVLSKTMAAALSYTAHFSHYVDGRPVSKTLKNTSEVVSFFDDLFDSVNGATTLSKKTRGKALRTAVTIKSKHVDFWTEAIKKLRNIKFIDKQGNEKSVPTLRNWVVTLTSYMELWQILKNEGVQIMRPRYFNSDPIENFFGQVRAYNYRNNNPDCHGFICTFKSLLITRFIKFHSDSFNCEDDVAKDMLTLKNIFQNFNSSDKSSDCKSNESQDHIPTITFTSMQDAARRERLNIHSRAYTTGWVVRKITTSLNLRCQTCKRNLTSASEETIHNWISAREYKTAVAQKKLAYPSEPAVRNYGIIVKETNGYLEEHSHKTNIVKNIKQLLLSKYPFEFLTCLVHRENVLNCFIEITVRLHVFNWCNVINQILKGTDISRLEKCNNLPPCQNKALVKFKKSLKNKSFNK